MGSSSSKSSRQVIEETPEQKRQRQIRQYGVLIPPVFAISTGRTNNNQHNNHYDGNSGNSHNNKVSTSPRQNRNIPLSAHDRLPVSPSLIDYLSATHFGHGILKDYMMPGIWVLAGGTDPTRNMTTTVRASLPLTTTSSTSGGGKISFASSPISSKSRVELCTGTDGPMNLFATLQLFPRAFAYGNMNSYGSSYVGCQLGFTLNNRRRKRPIVATTIIDSRDDMDDDNVDIMDDDEYDDGNDAAENNLIHIQIGSWVPLQWKPNRQERKAAPEWSTVPPSSQQPPPPPPLKQQQSPLCGWLESPQNVHGFLSVDMLGSTTAVETKWNVDTMDTQVSKYFSIRLDGGGTANDGDDTAESSAASPPLWLTMTSTPHTSAINISQLLTFDRINFNPLDVRAPKVRNTLGWTVQVEKPTTRASFSVDNNNNYDQPSQLSIAAAWQFNRNLALKVVGTSCPPPRGDSSSDPSSSSNANNHHYTCTYGVLLKRWKQPRMTCSILARHDFHTNTFNFMGIGLELETDASALFAGATTTGGGRDDFYAAPNAHVSDNGVPETKTALG